MKPDPHMILYAHGDEMIRGVRGLMMKLGKSLFKFLRGRSTIHIVEDFLNDLLRSHTLSILMKKSCKI